MRTAQKYIITAWISLVLLLGLGSQPATTTPSPYLATTEVTHQPAPLKHQNYFAASFAKSVKFRLPEVSIPIRLSAYARRVVQTLKNNKHLSAIDDAKIGYAHQKTSLINEDDAPARA